MSDESVVSVFVSSLSANQEIRRKQMQLVQVLDVKKIKYEKKDIASDEEAKKEYRRLMTRLGTPAALTPQIFNGKEYCGDYESFYFAVEEDRLKPFLHLAAPAPAPVPESTADGVPVVTEDGVQTAVETTT